MTELIDLNFGLKVFLINLLIGLDLFGFGLGPFGFDYRFLCPHLYVSMKRARTKQYNQPLQDETFGVVASSI
jgi:hypothetical protein